MEHKTIISLIWAITETVEIDDWSTEDIATLLKVEPDEVVDLINEIRDAYYEIREIEDQTMSYDRDDDTPLM